MLLIYKSPSNDFEKVYNKVYAEGRLYKQQAQSEASRLWQSIKTKLLEVATFLNKPTSKPADIRKFCKVLI